VQPGSEIGVHGGVSWREEKGVDTGKVAREYVDFPLPLDDVSTMHGRTQIPGISFWTAGVNAWRLMAVFDLALPSATTDPQFRAKPFRTRMKMLTRSVVPDDLVF
jgi:hypothetical protein